MRQPSAEESDSDRSSERISENDSDSDSDSNSDSGDDENDEDIKGRNVYSIQNSQGESISDKSGLHDETSNYDLRFLGIGDEDLYDRMAAVLTGTTTGRRIKRVIFKYGVIHLFLGIILIILSSYEGFNFPVTPFFQSVTHGTSVLVSAFHDRHIQVILVNIVLFLVIYSEGDASTHRTIHFSNKSLMWMVSFPIFFIGILSLIASYNWASLCTNR